MSIHARLRSLVLTMTREQRERYENVLRRVEAELGDYTLRDGHRLWVAERVLAGQKADVNQAVEFYESSRHTEAKRVPHDGPGTLDCGKATAIGNQYRRRE